MQTVEYEQLKTTTKYHKSDGSCLKALDKVLATKNVQWQAYYGQILVLIQNQQEASSFSIVGDRRMEGTPPLFKK